MNTTSRTRASIAGTLRDVGIAVDDDELLTAGVATADHLRTHHPDVRCLVLNDGPLDDLAGVTVVDPEEHPEVVVIGSAGASFSWNAFNLAARGVMDGAHWSRCTGLPRGERTPASASTQARTSRPSNGRRAGPPPSSGSPAPAMFDAALAHVGAAPTESVMVGDDLHNDVLAAQSLGIRGVLVRTGKYRREDLDASPEPPDAVIDSIADLPTWLGIEP